MLKQFYHRVSTATLLTLMLMTYHHLEKVTDNSQTPQLNSWIDNQLSFLSSTTEEAMKLLKDNLTLNQGNAYVCSENSIK